MVDLLKKEGNSPLLWEIKGRRDMSLKKTKYAEKDCKRAIELAPDYSRAQYKLGMLYIQQECLNDAESMLKKVLAENNRYIDAHMMPGMVYQQQGNIDCSNTHYRAVADLNQRNARGSNNLASNLVDYGGNLDEAIKFARKA
jgi:tetratricopeptide (TPR) repeat protein